MSLYFSNFPKVEYQVNDFFSLNVTNLTARFAFEQKFKNNIAAFYKYPIKEGDTPEIVAYKFYKEPERHWLVMYMNDIIDPIYDWYLNYDDLNRFVISKYGSIAYAQANTHSYYKVVKSVLTNISTKIEKFEIDQYTYNDLPETQYLQPITLPDNTTLTVTVSKETKTYYDYELEKNEKKREIKILKEEFVVPAEEEFKKLASGKYPIYTSQRYTSLI